MGLSGLTACGPTGEEPPPLACRALVAPPEASDPVRPTDTLQVIVAMDRREEPLELLVRVDRLEDEGIIVFPAGTPPTAAGGGVTVTIPPVYTVCVSSAPRVLVFQGAETPHDKVWMRISTDRPVEAVVRIGGDDGVTLEPSVVVGPGSSGRHRWTVPREGR